MRTHTFCEVCGNEVDRTASRCPFCGTGKTVELVGRQPNMLMKEVNLENGMPSVDEALLRLQNEISTASGLGYRLLCLIHGYGSSGSGGAIRKGVRRQLQNMYDRKKINDFIAGENCTSRSGHWRQMLRRFPELRAYSRINPGVTIVIL